MNHVLHRILISVASLGLCAGAIVAANSSPALPISSAPSQGTRTSLRANSPLFPAGPGQPLSASFDAPYLAIHHLSDLTLRRRDLDLAKLPLLLANLRTQAGAVPPSAQIASVITYCGPDPAMPDSEALDFVYGVSLVRQYGVGQEVHELYRLDNGHGTYLEVPEVSMPMDGALAVDDVLLLNFGCVPPAPGAGPAKRSRIEVLFAPPSAGFVNAWPSGESTLELRLALLSSLQFQTGMSLIAAHGEALYAELGQPTEIDPKNCNANPFCGIMPLHSECVFTINGFICRIKWHKVPCPLLNLNATILEGATLPESGFSPQPLAQSWEFRDTFLNKSATGRRYISWYYQLGALLEIDLVEVPAYVDLLGKASHAMDVLLDDSSTEVVISQDLANAILAVLTIQRGKISHAGMLSILDQVESDLMLLTGLNRADFTILFS